MGRVCFNSIKNVFSLRKRKMTGIWRNKKKREKSQSSSSFLFFKDLFWPHTSSLMLYLLHQLLAARLSGGLFLSLSPLCTEVDTLSESKWALSSIELFAFFYSLPVCTGVGLYVVCCRVHTLCLHTMLWVCMQMPHIHMVMHRNLTHSWIHTNLRIANGPFT